MIERHAVANAALRDELAHPHNERRAGNQREDDNDIRHDLRQLGREHNTVGAALEKEEIADGVDKTEAERHETSNLGNLLATGLAFLRPTSHSGNNALHKLHDNRCRNVGHDAKREHGEVRKRTAREQVKHGHADAALRKSISEFIEGDAGYGHVRAEAVQRQNTQGEQNLIPKLRHLERIDDGS